MKSLGYFEDGCERGLGTLVLPSLAPDLWCEFSIISASHSWHLVACQSHKANRQASISDGNLQNQQLNSSFLFLSSSPRSPLIQLAWAFCFLLEAKVWGRGVRCREKKSVEGYRIYLNKQDFFYQTLNFIRAIHLLKSTYSYRLRFWVVWREGWRNGGPGLAGALGRPDGRFFLLPINSFYLDHLGP